ncbi:MAG: YigZ family protein [Clostridia bacterium]|nr:YigZ family protein [Clostridia bacterium]
MENTFVTIKEKEYSAEIVEKRSKFIAKVIKVQSEDDVANELKKIKKEHRDARHNVFAYRLMNSGERMSDDGEPSGTAGAPILEILRGENLQNVLVVVTRYFGGILLGTGGLVRAYGTAAKNAVMSAEKVVMKLCNEYEVKTDYNYLNILTHYFKKQAITVRDTNFTDNISFRIIVETVLAEQILKDIEEKTARTATIDLIETYYQ